MVASADLLSSPDSPVYVPDHLPSAFSVGWRGGLPDLVGELTRQRERRHDAILPISEVRPVRSTRIFDNKAREVVTLCSDDVCLPQPLVLTSRSLVNLCERVSPTIPVRFMRSMLAEHPAKGIELLGYLMSQSEDRGLFRGLDGHARAVLSSKYRIFDDLDIATSCLGAIKDNGGVLLECTCSEERMEIKFTAPHIVEHIPESKGGGGSAKHISRSGINPNLLRANDPGSVCPFVSVSHSSVGEGKLNVSRGLLRMTCVNGAIMATDMGQVHLGRAMDRGVFTNETIAAESKSIMLQARDCIAASLRPERFKEMVNLAKQAAGSQITNTTGAVKMVAERFGLSEVDERSILEHFLRDYDSNVWGLAQAVSRTSQDSDDPSDAHKLEAASGVIVRGELFR